MPTFGTYWSGLAEGALSGPVLDDQYSPLQGVVPNLPPASNEWITDDSIGSGSFVPTLNLLMVWPLLIPSAFTAQEIGCWVATLQASSVTRLGVYANGSGDRPGALLFDAGTVDCSTTGVKTITITESIPAGLVWLAAAVQTAGGTMALLRFNSTTPRLPVTSSGNSLGNKPVVFTRSSVTGALPDPFGAATTAGLNSAPIIGLKRSA